jgi:anthraniloyl-CoA monooxygenase
VVERFQEAARQSAEYFEEVPRHWGLHPLQFAFNLLTRSGRIGHANLSLRDPALVRRVDAFLAAGERAPDGLVPLAAPPVFAPLRLGGLELRNRAAVTGLEAAARAGVGLAVTPVVAVSPEGRLTPECPVLDDAAPWREPVARAQAAGARVMLALSHAGRRGATRPRSEGVDLPLRDGGWPLVSASPIPYTPRSAVPAELDETGMARVRERFAAAAARAAEAGFDVLELNLGQGYLLGSFLSPLSNRRGDAYGGGLEARLRFPLEVVRAVREAWPAERPLAARLSVTDWSRRGLQAPDAVAIAVALREAGVALVHVVAGQTTAESGPEYRRGHLTAFSDHIRSEAQVRTLVGGYLDTLDAVNTIVGAGRSDLCLLEPAALH